MSILGLDEGDADGHAPVAGDVTQAVFLCCLSLALLCVLLGLVLLAAVK